MTGRDDIPFAQTIEPIVNELLEISRQLDGADWLESQYQPRADTRQRDFGSTHS